LSRLLNRKPFFCILFLYLFPCFSTTTLAQVLVDSAPSDATAIPEGVPELAIPERSSATGTRINRENAPAFKDILPAFSLKELLLANRIQLDAFSYLPYAWRLDDEWENYSTTEKTAQLIDSGPELVSEALSLERGLAFGSRSSLINELDPTILAHKLLWNSASNLWSQKLLSIDFEYSWQPKNKDPRIVSGKLNRAYPKALDPENTTTQLFREILTFTSPVQLRNFSWLTFRFLGIDEDAVWTYSPVIKKIRQLTGTNRHDALYGSALSLDDFFTWSGKNENTIGRVLSTPTILTPFPSLQMARAQESDHCLYVSPPPQAPRPSIADYRGGYISSSQFSFPAGTIFVPREMYELELTSRDPYSQFGRQILYIDTASMLPVYKIIFNTSGQHIKTVITAWGLAITSDRNKKAPFPGFTAIIDEQNEQSALITYSNTRYCSSFPEGESLVDYEPRSLLGVRDNQQES